MSIDNLLGEEIEMDEPEDDNALANAPVTIETREEMVRICRDDNESSLTAQIPSANNVVA